MISQAELVQHLYLLKIIPRADGSGPRICELVRFHFEEINLKEV